MPIHVTSGSDVAEPVSARAPEFVRNVLGAMIAGKGDGLPVSALPPDGTFPTGTAKWEKRNIALQIPVWDEQLCIQCGTCSSFVRTRSYAQRSTGKMRSRQLLLV